MASDSSSPAYVCVPCSSTDEFNCAVCKQLLGEPFLSDCCGDHFCKSCIVPHLRPKSCRNSTPCPNCNAATFRVMLDKSFLRRLNDLEVFCPLRSYGCEWTGRQGDVKKHADIETGNCDYVDIECVYKCGTSVQRRNLEHHVQEECPRRRSRCQYCGYEDTRELLLTEHEQACKKFPLACPNNCEQSPIERGKLESHLLQCPLQEVECGFKAIGCTGAILRRDLQGHLQESSFTHTMLVYTFSQTTSEKLKKAENEVRMVRVELDKRNEAIATLEQKVTGLQFDLQQKDVQVQELQRQLDSSEQRMMEMQARLGTLEATMSVFLEGDPHRELAQEATGSDREDDSFWSQLGERMREPSSATGYNSAATAPSTDGASASPKRSSSRSSSFAKAPSLDPNCLSTYDLPIEALKTGSHSHWGEAFYTQEPGYNMQLDVYYRKPSPSSQRQLCVYVYILRGKYDEALEWPLKATVAMQLIDRTGSYKPTCRSITGIWNKVTHPVMNRGEGHSVNFIGEEEMGRYLSDGVLHIRVLSVLVHSLSESMPSTV